MWNYWLYSTHIKRFIWLMLISVLYFLLIPTLYIYFMHTKNFTNHGPLTRYVNPWPARAPGMPGKFSPPLVSDPGMHHCTCVTRVPWCMSGSLTCGGGENVPGACATRNFTFWQDAHDKISYKMERLSCCGTICIYLHIKVNLNHYINQCSSVMPYDVNVGRCVNWILLIVLKLYQNIL